MNMYRARIVRGRNQDQNLQITLPLRDVLMAYLASDSDGASAVVNSAGRPRGSTSMTRQAGDRMYKVLDCGCQHPASLHGLPVGPCWAPGCKCPGPTSSRTHWKAPSGQRA